MHKIPMSFKTFLNSAHFDINAPTLNEPEVLTVFAFDGPCYIEMMQDPSIRYTVISGNKEDSFPQGKFMDAVKCLYEKWYLPEICGVEK